MACLGGLAGLLIWICEQRKKLTLSPTTVSTGETALSDTTIVSTVPPTERFLGYMLRLPPTSVWNTVEDNDRNRLLAREMFGLSEEDARHPTLCFHEPEWLTVIFPRLLEVWRYRA